MIFEDENLKCLILFGSHARGDQTIESDIDLLGINESKKFTVRNIDSVNFSFYSPTKALDMSCNGDLFFLHIIKEGKCLFNEVFFTQLKSSFRFKNSYIDEASVAFYLALKIFENKDKIINWPVANKRISWCVRTILIALSAENKTPYFSKSQLSLALINNGFSFEDSVLLIDAKNKKEKSDYILNLLLYFTVKYSFLKSKIKKKDFYSSSIVHVTLDTIINSIPVNYE